MAKKASGSKAKSSTSAEVPPVASTSTSTSTSTAIITPNSNRKRSRAAASFTAAEDAKDTVLEVEESSDRGGKRKKKNPPAPDVLEEQGSAVASTSAGTAEIAMLDAEGIAIAKFGKKDKKEKKQTPAVLLEEEETPASSSTIDVDEVEEIVITSDKKGKGKAKDQGAAAEEGPAEPSLSAQETIRLRKEVSFKDSLLLSQSILLTSLRNTMACTVCLEILDTPYSLACGHVFCRKCLVTWFHRNSTRTPVVHPISESSSSDSSSESSSDSDDSSIAGSDILLSAGSRSPRPSTNRHTGEDMGDRTSSEESSTDPSSSESDEDTPVLRATFGGRTVDVNPVGGTTSDAAWSTMQNTFADVAARYMGTTAPSVAPPGRIRTERTERRMAAMREARLRVFDGNSTAGGSAAQPLIASTSAPARRTSSPVVVVPVVPTSDRPVQDRIPAVAPAPRAIPPRAPTGVHRPPTGAHRTVNLICPHCRDPVHNTPFRVFVLTELVELVRQAESDGLLSTGSGSTSGLTAEEKLKEKKEAEDNLPGLAESDTTWGGLFRGSGAPETNKEKRERLAQVMVDTDDAVIRCPGCNWEVSRETGACEGCNRTWELPSDVESLVDEDLDLDLGAGFLLPSFNQHLNYEDRSSDEEPDEDDERFIDDDSHFPAAIGSENDSDSSSSSSSEESAAETPDKRSKRKGKGKEKRRIKIADSSDEESEGEEDDSVIVEEVESKSKPKAKGKKRSSNEVQLESMAISSSDSSVASSASSSSGSESEGEGEGEVSAHFAKDKGKGKAVAKVVEKAESEDESEEKEKDRRRDKKAGTSARFKKRTIVVDDEDESD